MVHIFEKKHHLNQQKMKNVRTRVSLFIMCAATVTLTTVACMPGKDSKDATADSLRAKITSDSILLVEKNSKEKIYTAGIGKVNLAKKNGKGEVVLQWTKAMEDEYAKMLIEADVQGIYYRTEIKPSYPGGEAALAKFIQNNIVYPEPAIENGVEASIDVVFAVDENGKVYTPVVKGERTGYGLDEAATDVVSKMPRWNPGQIKGKNVKSYYSLPITFRIN